MSAPRIEKSGDSLLREMERNVLRSRNGLQMLSGRRFARTGATPKDVVWNARKAQLWRYRRTEPARFATPVLLYIGLVSRSYVFDLHPGNSFVERLLQSGFDVLVLDWGEPDEADADNDLATYCHDLLPRAMRAAVRETGSPLLNVIAYCLGGTMTLLTLGTVAGLPIRSLISLATPVDFSRMGEFYRPLGTGNFDPRRAVDETGNVPASTIHNLVRVRRPTGDLVQYANLWQNLWNDEFLEGYQAMREWVADHLPLPGGVFREVLATLLVENGLVKGTARVGGRRVDLDQVRLPILCLLAEHDEMVPLAAADPLPALFGSTAVKLETIRSGHVSLVCGRRMETKTMPIVTGWLEQHSEAARDGGKSAET